MSKRNALVTGGLGFIGSELVRQLKESDEFDKVVVVDCAEHWSILDSHKTLVYGLDLTNEDDIGEYNHLLDHHKIDVVFGLAALIGGIKYFHDHPADILSQNHTITDNTLNGIRHSKKKPLFTYISSSMVFEEAENFPTKEHETDRTPRSAYGFSKLNGEFLCEAYWEQHNIRYAIARPFNAFGCNEYPKEVGIAHVVPDLIKKVLDGQGTEDNPLQILGDGNQIRCYTHVSDIANGIIRVSEASGPLTSFNISSPKPHSVNEVAELIWNHIHGGDKYLYRTYLPPLTYDVQKRIPDVTKAKEQLGWTAKYVLEDKIDEVISWVKSVN